MESGKQTSSDGGETKRGAAAGTMVPSWRVAHEQAIKRLHMRHAP